MSALTQLTQMGITVRLSKTGKIKLQGKMGQMDQEQIERAMEYARKNKPAILAALTQTGVPGECESCPAAGYWDYAHYASRGLLCFHSVYFLGKTARPKPCNETKGNCPRKETD